jgi:hypothetical protein
MIAIVVFSLLAAAALALLMAGSRPRALARPDARPRLSGAQLRELVVSLLDKMGLTVVEEELLGDDRRMIAAQRDVEVPAARYVVFVAANPPADRVPPSLLLELAETIKGERATAGMLVTPYEIDAGHGSLEVPIELVDGARLRELIAHHLPRRAAELDRYRGISAPSRPLAPTPA